MWRLLQRIWKNWKRTATSLVIGKFGRTMPPSVPSLKVVIFSTLINVFQSDSTRLLSAEFELCRIMYTKFSSLVWYFVEVFEPFFRSYIEKYKHKTATTEEWKAYLFEYFSDQVWITRL